MRLVGPQTAPEVYERFTTRAAVAAAPCCDAGGGRALRSRALLPARARARAALAAPLRSSCCSASTLCTRRMVHTDIKTKHFMRFGGEWKLVDYDNATMENERASPAARSGTRRRRVAARVGAGVVKVRAWAWIVLYDLFAGEPLLSTDDGEVELGRYTQAAVACTPREAPVRARRRRRSSSPTPRRHLGDRVLNKSFFENEDTEQAASSRCSLFSSPTRWKTGHASSRSSW